MDSLRLIRRRRLWVTAVGWRVGNGFQFVIADQICVGSELAKIQSQQGSIRMRPIRVLELDKRDYPCLNRRVTETGENSQNGIS